MLNHAILYNEPMSRHTSWRIGGPADRFYQPANLDDLQAFLKTLPASEPLTWLGLGSNMLVRDAGIRGTVIATQACLMELNQLDDVTIRAEAGVACAQLARFCARLGLAGAEFWAGIPGTVGGALAMNAGCFGSETWDKVVATESMDRTGKRMMRKPEEYKIGYRSVEGPIDEWFVAGHFCLKPGEKEKSLELIRHLLKSRAEKQPTGEPSCGSVFRNPPGEYAAKLIEACGLKGMRMGGAIVSEKHANFILNREDATAADVEKLIAYVAEKVKEKYGIVLIPEVRVVGELC